MKQALLLLLLCLTLTACGQGQPAATPETAAPAPEIQIDPQDPIGNYLDLTQMDPAVLAACTQALDLESQKEGVTVTARKLVGDAMTLYLDLSVTYPEGTDLTQAAGGEEISFFLLQGKHTDPAQALAASSAIPGQGEGLPGEDGRTLSYVVCFPLDREVLTAGKEVTLLVRTAQAVQSSHLLHWTMATQGSFRYADLKDGEGTVVGTAVLSPFALNIDLWTDAGMEPEALGASLLLRDKDDAPTQASYALSASEDTRRLAYQFYAPLDLARLASFTVGPYTAALSA